MKTVSRPQFLFVLMKVLTLNSDDKVKMLAPKASALANNTLWLSSLTHDDKNNN
jgi:hypothetical protein